MPAFDQSSSFAILFGVANYDNSSAYESMSWIENNLTELRAILVDEELVGFRDDDEHTLVKLNPTYGQLGDDLDAIRKRHTSIDTLFVYYCGHGVVQGGKYYLTGTNSSDTTAGKLLFDTFEDIFLAIKAKRKLLILDSCFSGRAVPHLSNSSSVLEVNVDRLAEKERKSSEIDSTRKGTYVVASADRDKPSPSTDGTGELTAFTSLLVNRIRQGLERREDDRLTITDVVEALKTEASLKGLPEPVTSDKLGLGSWRLVGNAFVVKKKKFEADIEGKIKEVVSSAVSSIRTELSACLTKTAQISEIEALKSQIAGLTVQIGQLSQQPIGKLDQPPSGSSSRASEPTRQPGLFLANIFQRAFWCLLAMMMWLTVALVGSFVLWLRVAERLVVEVYVTAAYVLAVFALEWKYQGLFRSDNFPHQTTLWDRLVERSLLLGSIARGFNAPLKLVGPRRIFWALLIGIALTWLVPIVGLTTSEWSTPFAGSTTGVH